MLVDTSLFLPGFIGGLIGGGIILATKLTRKHMERVQAKSDEQAIAARMVEVLAAVSGMDPDKWPHELPKALENHRHIWMPNHTCPCGAYLEHGMIYNFTRGQVVSIGGTWHRVIMMNLPGCKHWVLDGFEVDPEMGPYRHFTTTSLLSAMRGERQTSDAD